MRAETERVGELVQEILEARRQSVSYQRVRLPL